MNTLRAARPDRYASQDTVERIYLASPEAVSQARHLTERTLAGWGVTGSAGDDAALVADELAANAARYGGCCCPPEFVLRLSLRPGAVIIQAGDRYPGAPQRPARRVRWRAESGRGLPITRTLSAQLAWYRESGGWKFVWAEMAVPQQAAVGQASGREHLVVAA